MTDDEFWQLMDAMFGPEIRCEPGQTEKPTRETCTRHQDHYWCKTCQGYYGVPHDGMHGPGGHHNGLAFLHDARQCACRPCRDQVARSDARAEVRSQQGSGTDG